MAFSIFTHQQDVAMLSKTTYILCVFVMCYVAFVFCPKWKMPATEATIGWDVSGYYWYLPSAIIYKDLKQQKFADSIIPRYSPTPSFEQSYIHESGNRVMTYSSGMAFMYLPFFTVAHLIAEPLGFPADGFSPPYQLALYIGSFLTAITGLWFFRRLLLIYLEDKVVAIMLFLLVIGTNYLNYSAIESCLTHNWLFTIYTLILLSTISFYNRPSANGAMRIGILTGLAILIRPSEMVAILLPLLWGMNSLSATEVRKKFAFLKANIRYIGITTACIIAIGSIQIAYWMYVTGQPLVYSYDKIGFDWLSPHFADYMLSYRSGWLTYTPLLFLSFVGLVPFIRKGENRVAIIAFFAITLYIVCSWEAWWYGGTGGRAMIQSYPVILFPFAYLVRELLTTRIAKWVAAPIILLFVYVNIWFTYNAHVAGGLYEPGGMTGPYFWAVIGRYHAHGETDKLKDTDELFTDAPRNMKLLYRNTYETDSTVPDTLAAIEGKRSVYLSEHNIFTPPAAIPYSPGMSNWIRAQVKFHIDWADITTGWKMPLLVVRFYHKDKIVKERAIKVYRFLYYGQTKDIHIDVKTPAEPFDTVSALVWYHTGGEYLVADDMRIWSFD